MNLTNETIQSIDLSRKLFITLNENIDLLDKNVTQLRLKRCPNSQKLYNDAYIVTDSISHISEIVSSGASKVLKSIIDHSKDESYKLLYQEFTHIYMFSTTSLHSAILVLDECSRLNSEILGKCVPKPLSEVFLTVNGKQKNRIETYNPTCSGCNGDGCSGGRCSAFTKWHSCNTDINGSSDWRFDTDEGECIFTCPNKPTCSKLDKNFCKIGNDSLIDSEWKTGNEAIDPTVSCYYNSNILHHIPLSNFLSKFPNEVNTFNKLALNYCSGISKDCFKLGNCSFYNDITDKGKFCKTFLNNQSPQDKDSIKIEHCQEFDTEDCKCINRAFDQTYIELKKNVVNDTNDGCWYMPCANPDNYLVTENNLNPVCQQNICQNLIAVSQVNGNVSISDIKELTTCSFDNNPDPEIPDSPDIPPKKMNWAPFLIIGGVFLLILITVVLYIIMRKQ